MKTDNLEFYQTDVQGELEIWKDKNTDNVFYVPVKIIRDFDNLSVCNINKWDGIKKWARCCSVTGKGMNNGWIWGDGDFYVKNQDDAMNECWKDRYDIRDELFTYIDNMKLDNISKRFKSETINKIDTLVNLWDKQTSPYLSFTTYDEITEEIVSKCKDNECLPRLDNMVTGYEVKLFIEILKKMVSNQVYKENQIIKDDYFFLANMLDNMYYTEWECEDDYQYVEIDGKLICYDEHE